jgi:dTDP-4-amino-4,6-dideoxygalactose transaminase
MTAYKAIDVELPVTERVGKDVIALPVYTDMTQAEIDTLASALQNVKNGY